MKINLLFIVTVVTLLSCPKVSFGQAETTTTNMPPQGSVAWGTRDMSYHGQNYDVLDSNYIPRYRKGQMRKFMGHAYVFPPKPRSMWEVGFGAGTYNIFGDVPSSFGLRDGGYGMHIQVRKAWGYVFSTRLQYIYGIAKGLDYQLKYPSSNPAWAGYNSATSSVVNNYRMESHQLNLDLIFNIANINFHKARTGVIFYGYVGLGVMAFNTRINAKDANNNPYDFASIIGSTPQKYANRKSILSSLRSAMDDSYETSAEDQQNTKSQIFGNKTMDWTPSVGVGTQFRLNDRMNFQIEDRISMPDNEDLVDGVRWANSQGQQMTMNNDLINYFSVGINFNIGNKHKNVVPLYWINPLDFAYSELDNPRHMILPDAVLTDTDNDGIADQLDKCPNTQAGVRVDTHGCPFDTDGDGVPDYLDKQLITPSECQPVDADGIGKCPCPDACKALLNGATASCNNISSGSIIFPDHTNKLTADMQVKLGILAAQMQANPTCKVSLAGLGNSNKIEMQRSWDHVNTVIQYMTDKKYIDRHRFIFQYGQAGDSNSLEYHTAMNGEDGASNVAPPYPQLRKK